MQNPNLEILMYAVEQLGTLADEMVFLGGCATGLLITDFAAPPLRVTKDVDALVQVLSLTEYYKFSDKLRAQGFTEDLSQNAPICRWISGSVILDVMPDDPNILGFGNKWYASAIEHAQTVKLSNSKRIRMVSAPYFFITKLEAFDGRGNGDYQMSHDMEDIIAVLDGRPKILEEIKQSPPKLSSELSKRIRNLLNDIRFVDAVTGHMPGDEASQARVPIILERLKKMSELAE